MADSEQKIELNDDPFDLDPYEIRPDNHRKSTRYIRQDIKVRVLFGNALGLKKTIETELNDISSRGALVTTPCKLGISKKITLVITFDDGQIFRFSGKIVRKCPSARYRYGIKFERQENDLGDYLLKTQTDLTFK